jgi:hypothetical protein
MEPDYLTTPCKVARRAAAVALLLLTTPVWAGRPLTTEDAGEVLKVGQCELESYLARWRKPDLRYQWAQLSCGTGFDTQVAAGAGREHAGAEHITIAAFSGKTSLRKLTGEQAGIALAYAVLGGRHLDHMRHEASEIKAVLTVPHEQWLLHANAGWVRTYASGADKTIWALALERREAIASVDLMCEMFGDDRASPFAQVAARWTVIADRLFVDTSWGTQLNGKSNQQATVGLKLAF